MDIKKFLKAWIAAAKAYDTDQYLNFYLTDAVLDDPSVGKKFTGHKGIKKYFDSYFIGYKTQTKITKLKIAPTDGRCIGLCYCAARGHTNIKII